MVWNTQRMEEPKLLDVCRNTKGHEKEEEPVSDGDKE
mgnify:CR=1 FL=1